MPSGYTEDLYNGKPVTFKQFAMKTSRAFGALIHMKEDSLEAEYRPAEVSPYHVESLKKAREYLDELEDMTLEEATRRADESYIDTVIAVNESNQNGVIRGKAYQDMLDQVNAWEIPTPDHESFKGFMIDQLEESIRFDVHYTDLDEIKSYSGEEWLQKEMNLTLENIDYYVSMGAKEKMRVEGANRWVEDLVKSLG